MEWVGGFFLLHLYLEAIMVIQGVDIQKLIDDSKAVILDPKSYFNTMPIEGGYVEPLIKALFYGAVAGVFGLIWGLIGLGGVGGGSWILAPIKSIIIAAIGLFVSGGIILLISAACNGNPGYEASVRVSAALMVLYPVNAALSFLFGISIVLGALISLVISLYGLYLLLCGVVVSLDGKEKTAMIVVIALAVLLVLMNGCSMMAMRHAQDISATITGSMPSN